MPFEPQLLNFGPRVLGGRPQLPNWTPDCPKKLAHTNFVTFNAGDEIPVRQNENCTNHRTGRGLLSFQTWMECSSFGEALKAFKLAARDRLLGLLFSVRPGKHTLRPALHTLIVVLYHAPLERTAGLGSDVSVTRPARMCLACNRISLISVETVILSARPKSDGCGG